MSHVNLTNIFINLKIQRRMTYNTTSINLSNQLTLQPTKTNKNKS